MIIQILLGVMFGLALVLLAMALQDGSVIVVILAVMIAALAFFLRFIRPPDDDPSRGR